MKKMILVAFSLICFCSFAEDVDKSISRRDNTIIIHLRGCGAGEDTFFIRASIIVPVFGYENDKVYARTKNQPQVISVVFAYDETPPEQKIAEYEAVYHSAMEKIRKQETLDFDEYCIATQIRTDIGQDFYWGNKALKENRFWDAIVYFENVYYALQGNWLSNDMSNESQDMFFHTCYLLGFCYAEMKLWEKAIFYLDIVFPLDNASYKMEYINCLVNSGDFRAILVIQKELERVSHSDVNEAPEYYAFLRRRWVYMRIEMNDLDYAEKMLKEMLKEKGNKEFAQIELEHISRLREACK